MRGNSPWSSLRILACGRWQAPAQAPVSSPQVLPLVFFRPPFCCRRQARPVGATGSEQQEQALSFHPALSVQLVVARLSGLDHYPRWW